MDSDQVLTQQHAEGWGQARSEMGPGLGSGVRVGSGLCQIVDR